MTKDSPKTKFSDYFFVLNFAFMEKFLFFCMKERKQQSLNLMRDAHIEQYIFCSTFF
jgi:hypothetical protein